jgi:hypothetical protein
MILNEIQRAAFESRELGWSVIPIAPRRKDRPLVKWAQYQNELPSDRDLTKWFRDPRTNMAVITGQVSNGLVIVDCDDAAPSTDWTETVVSKSGREEGLGYHLFYRSPKKTATHRFDWGEIRGEGGYTVMPPSIHPSGNPYSWYIAPSESEIGLLPRDLVAEATPRTPYSSSGRRSENANTNTSSNSLDTAALPPEGSWSSYYCDPKAVLRVAEVMGVTAPLKTNFHCVLPGHDEFNPSAVLYPNRKGFFVYLDNHLRDRHLVYTLPEVRASLAYGKATTLNAPEAATWGIRALVEAGVIEPVALSARKLLDGSPATRAVYEGFLSLLSCKWHIDYGAPTAFTRDFAAAWCAVTSKQARQATSTLTKDGFINFVSGVVCQAPSAAHLHPSPDREHPAAHS